jgi:hypothetical protein
VIHRAIAALAIAASATTAAAQTGQPAQSAQAASPARTIELLPRYTFHLTAEHMSTSDERFVWDTNFGGELDFVDYGVGRGTFVANYQAILGEQFRRFDPNQGNYILGGSLSARTSLFEIAALFHHESRHLSDRTKRQAVDWNMIGARLLADQTRGRLKLQEHADLSGVVQKSFVDYRWQVDADVHARVGVSPRVALVSAGDVRLLGVDGTRNRGTQAGVRGEGGVRIEGRGAAVELFLAGERRIDPYPLEFGTATWLTAGFRLLSR